jgi:hypothetical protein
MSQQIIEEIISLFGRTGSIKRPRIRKFHAKLLYDKYLRKERLLLPKEIDRPKDYIMRLVNFSNGCLEFINESKLEIEITQKFFDLIDIWTNQYDDIEDLGFDDEKLTTQGILIEDENICFDGNLNYSTFYKLISNEDENMNNPEEWEFNDQNIEMHESIDFANKNCAVFGSKLFLMKFYILSKIDEVSFVTSRFVHCPVCGANYVVPASKIDFQQTYHCEKMVGDKPCRTALKKFPVRKMIPTYIFEIGVEVKTKSGT